MGNLVFRLKALTEIWTGGVEGKNDKLHVTGIKGSIRWWYEVLIRGLDCYACDPTSNGHCELKPKELNRDQPLAPQIKEQICPACYMFGCTGWSGKFNLRINDNSGKIITEQLSEEDHFILEFIERKEFEPAEILLLKMILKLIVDYGAIGGRTVFKPSEYPDKNTKKIYHNDFGILERGTGSNIPDPTEKIKDENLLNGYLEKFKSLALNIDWPNLKNFWFVKGVYINRIEHNKIAKRNTTNPKYYESIASELNVFIGGYITERRSKVIPSALKEKVKRRSTQSDGESKKIFSFHGQGSGITRCYGYARREEFYDIVELIIDNIDTSTRIICGTEVLNEL